MLDSLRNMARTWVAKVLLLLLILSLAIWGISGQILGGGTGNVVLQAGETTINAQQYRLAYQRVLQEQSQRFGTRLSREQAQMLGIENAVRAQLVGGAVLDEQARVMGLGLTEERLARAIAEDFGGSASGDQIRLLLRDIGMRPEDYVRERESAAIRQQLVEAFADGIAAPDAFLAALHRHSGQTRDVSYLVIEASNLTDVGQPTQAELDSYFEDNLAAYRAPEYRTIQYVLLTPETVADPALVDDATVRDEYEDNRARYAEPEMRTIQQIVFTDRAAADDARQRIADGTAFETIAAELDRSIADITLGTFARGQVPSQAIADAAFAIAEAGDISDVFDGDFGPAIVRVTEITPEQVRPFEEVAETIRLELAMLEARDVLLDIHDGYEDARAGGASMAEAAATQRLNVRTAPAVDRRGTGTNGEPVADLPEPGALLDAAFAAGIGEESPPLSAGREGFLWYEVTDIAADRDRTLDEVRDRVIEDWRTTQSALALDTAAEEAAQSIRDGTNPAALASEMGYRAGTRFGLARSASDDTFSGQALGAVFDAGPREVSNASADGGDSRVVFRVDSITSPVGGAEQIEDQLAQQVAFNLTDDLLNQMVGRLQQEFPVVLFPAALERALDTTGGNAGI